MTSRNHSRTFLIIGLFTMSLLTPLTSNASSEDVDEISILHTAVNPANNNTYHLLSAASWEESAFAARGLNGFLATIDDVDENNWIFETFANYDNQSRHLWTGLSDHDQEGYYKWHDGTPFYYRNWGQDQPSSGGDEDYVHIAGTNMGNIMPGSWNDLENNPQYFPVYGVVEIGPGADYALRFDGDDDYIIIDEEMPDWDGHIEIEAMVNLPDINGINFIVMFADYGWGLYLNNGFLAYSNEYSMSSNPTSNISIQGGVWTHVKVIIDDQTGGEFFIDDLSAGLIDTSNSTIPSGDFGSNSCFQSGLECDELYIGKMGAGCDCNYFKGMLDDVIISNDANETAWQFTEGEGMNTFDNIVRQGEIHGASWVMPDGSIVTQAIQLFNGDEISEISGMPGDQILFFAEIDEMTKAAYFTAFEDFDDFSFDEETGFQIYVAHEYIPNSWNYDELFETDWGFMFEEWEWPSAGTWWFVVVPLREIEDLSLGLNWEIADPPPPLEEMTELINAIPITDQTISGGRQSPLEDRVLYYYVNVTENLSSLTVKTYGGTGNIDLGMSWGTVPDPFGFGFFPGSVQSFFADDADDILGNEQEIEQKVAWDGGPGNDQIVTIYDIEPGLYYITAYTYQRATDFTIVAKLTYQPNNVEPEDAIELEPGVAYGPLSGYDGLEQFFKIVVPTGTERLEVDLSDGFGQASLFMKIENAPTSSDFTYLSSSPGAGDKIGFNDPTPGMWFILLNTEGVFGEVMITASFEERYVWSYDGTPIELFNSEEIVGMQAPKGEELFFFLNLEKPGEYLQISTYGGSGELVLNLEGKQIIFDFDDVFIDFQDGEMGRQSRPNLDTESEDIDIDSNGDGTLQNIYVNLPANGRFDVTLTAQSEITDVTIVAKWVYSDFIEPVDEEPIVEPIAEESCRDFANNIMEATDLNDDGLIDEEEITKSDFDFDLKDFDTYDINQDGEIEFAEVLQEACNCDNEIWIIFDQLSDDGDSMSIELMSSQIYQNEYDFIGIDANSDRRISETEIEIMALICETSFDAFDRDGDGVPDVDDEFPEDPDESKDTDGDGVGDNADIAPSIANDLVYSIGAIVFIGLLALLVLFARGNRTDLNSNPWDDEKQFDITETMLGMQDPEVSQLPEHNMTGNNDVFQTEVMNNKSPEISDEQQPVQSTAPKGVDIDSIELSSFEELLNSDIAIEAPSNQLLGMIGMDGKESIEYPTNSGIKWTRETAGDQWNRT